MKIDRWVATFLLFIAGLAACSSKSPPAAQVCRHRTDCPTPYVCLNGSCISECNGGPDCPDPHACTETQVMGGGMAGVCQPPTVPPPQCQTSDDCTDPQQCAPDGRCRPICTKDSNCLFKSVRCVEGFCVLPSTAELTTMDGMTVFAVSGTGGAANDGAAGADSGQGGDTAGDGGAGDGPLARLVTAVAQPALVRQGIGPNMVTVTVTADNGLAHAKGFTFTGTTPDGSGNGSTSSDSGADGGGSGGGAPVLAATAVASMSSDTMLVLSVTVPHGVALGKKTLTFTSDGGPAYSPNVLEISAITAGPDGMDSNVGTSAAPFRTFKQAVSVGDSGDTIKLLNGTYDASSGEDWKAALPAQLTVRGESTSGTVLAGPGAMSGLVAFTPKGDLAVENLTAQYFHDGINLTTSATITLTNVVLDHNEGYCDICLNGNAKNSRILIQGADTQLGGNTIVHTENGANNVTITITDARLNPPVGFYYLEGFSINGDSSTITLSNVRMTRQFGSSTGCTSLVSIGGTGSSLSITGSTLQQVGCSFNGVGAIFSIGGSAHKISIADTSLITHGIDGALDGNGTKSSKIIITNVTSDGKIYLGRENSTSQNTLTITDSPQISFSASPGISINGDLTLTRSVLDGTIDQTIDFSGGTLIARGSTFKNYKVAALTVHSGKADLGTMLESGKNTFQDIGNNSAVAIDDERAANSDPITCSDSTFNGVSQAPATFMTAKSAPPVYKIANEGSTIQFVAKQ